jgi:hypothetical protein
MAVTISKPSGGDFNIGNKRVRVRDVTFTGNYATGGEAITLSQVGLRTCLTVYGTVTEGAGAATGLPVRWDATNSKLQLYESGAANAPLAEKGSAEAYAATTAGRLTFVGT